MIAIGIGCRRGTPQAAIVQIVQQALAQAGTTNETIELFSIDDKRDELGLVMAAREMGLKIGFLSCAALREVGDKVLTPSPPAEAAFAVASVSEAAALAGAGRNGALVVPRISGSGVTCAIARGDGQ